MMVLVSLRDLHLTRHMLSVLVTISRATLDQGMTPGGREGRREVGRWEGGRENEREVGGEGGRERRREEKMGSEGGSEGWKVGGGRERNLIHISDRFL